MSNENGSLEFKVIKRIPLSSVTSKKPNFNNKQSKLQRMDVNIPLKENIIVPSEFKSVKKVDLKVDYDKIDSLKENILKTKDDNLDVKKDNLDVKKDNLDVKKDNLDVKKDNLDLPFPIKKKKTHKKHKFPKKTKKLFLPKQKDFSDNSLMIVSKNDSSLKTPSIISKEEVLKKDTLKSNSKDKSTSFKSKEVPKIIDNSIKKEISFDNSLLETKSSDFLKGVLDNLSNSQKIDKKKDFYESYKDKEHDVNNLLDKLNKKTSSLNQDVFLESFSFLDDKPKVKKMDFSSYSKKNLYSKLDDVIKNYAEKNKAVQPLSQNQKDSPNYNNLENKTFDDSDFNLMEEIEVPDISPIDDYSKDISHEVDSKYTSLENSNNKTKYSSSDLKTEGVKILNDDSNLMSVVKTNENIEKIPNFVFDNKKLKLNSEIEDRIIKNSPKIPEKFDINSFNVRMNADDADAKKKLSDINISKEDDSKIIEGMKNISKSNEINETKIYKKVKKKPIVKKDLISERFKDLKEKDVDYILPKDAGKNPIQLKTQIYQDEISSDNKLFSSLVYTDSIVNTNRDLEKTFEKYSIDDFTYVTIHYSKDSGLFYNIVQPELSVEEEIEFNKIKNIFFNTIDKNYYSFNGDKHSLNNYIEKIYEISLDKLSYNLNNLQKKLYFKFIQRDFFGLGILTNLLRDKKILEVSCSGEKSNLSVYHVEYGILKTNISFSNISELNKFVLILTKNMGLYVTQSHPIIDGYLPNGYKVEGLYSVGDTSSRGSSFVIKKYLDEPLTPVSLIETGIGTIDVFSYIWSAILEDYKVILVDTDDSFLVFNSLLLFLPEKKIITVQAYDRFKLPQKEWINRIFTTNQDLNKKLLIEQTISQKPDYIVVDEFGKDLFNSSWYNLDFFSIIPEISTELIEQLKIVNQKAIVIELRKIKTKMKEILQIISIKEINNKKESVVVEIDMSRNLYTLNLLASSINIVQFLKHKKLMRWMKDSKVNNYKDFNNIVSEFYFQKDKIFERLDIKE